MIFENEFWEIVKQHNIMNMWAEAEFHSTPTFEFIRWRLQQFEITYFFSSFSVIVIIRRWNKRLWDELFTATLKLLRQGHDYGIMIIITMFIIYNYYSVIIIIILSL